MSIIVDGISSGHFPPRTSYNIAMRVSINGVEVATPKNGIKFIISFLGDSVSDYKLVKNFHKKWNATKASHIMTDIGMAELFEDVRFIEAQLSMLNDYFGRELGSAKL